MNLYVSNLSQETTEQELAKAFSVFGAIKSYKIIIDKETGLSKGFGFVEMEDNEQAMDAIDNLDMSYLLGNIINVREAKNNRNGNSQQNQSYQKRDGGNKSYQQRRDYSNSKDNTSFNTDNSSLDSWESDTDFNNDLSYHA